MNITHLTYEYDVYYNGEKLNNIIDMEYKVLASTIGGNDYVEISIGGNDYVEISITYIDDNGNMKHIHTDSKNIKFEKRNESSRLCVAKEEE